MTGRHLLSMIYAQYVSVACSYSMQAVLVLVDHKNNLA